jgi:hypothetical protein
MGKEADWSGRVINLSTKRKKEAKKEKLLLLLIKGRNNVGISCCIPYWQNLLYFHSAVTFWRDLDELHKRHVFSFLSRPCFAHFSVLSIGRHTSRFFCPSPR